MRDFGFDYLQPSLKAYSYKLIANSYNPHFIIQ